MRFFKMYRAATIPYKTNLIPTVMPLPLPSPASPPLPSLELGGGNLGGPTTAFTSFMSFFTSINSFLASYRSFFTSINSFLTSSNASFSPSPQYVSFRFLRQLHLPLILILPCPFQSRNPILFWQLPLKSCHEYL